MTPKMNLAGNYLRIIVLITFIFPIPEAASQNPDNNFGKSSVGITFGIIPKHHDEVLIPVIDIDYSYSLNEKWALGAGTGVHFSSKPFYVVALRADANIYRSFSAGIAIGTAIIDNRMHALAGIDLGLTYSFRRLEAGPVAEFSYHNRHSHLMLGLSVSYRLPAKAGNEKRGNHNGSP